MVQAFEDIRIVELDERNSRQTGPAPAMYSVYFRLSREAPHQWAHYFVEQWQSVISTNHKHARIEGGHIIIEYCPLELVKQFKAKLAESIEHANTQYRSYLSRQEAEEQKAKEREKKDREQLKTLKNDMRFD